jgi:hypothetical protein
MTEPRTHEVQIVAASPDEIRELLGVHGDLPAGGEVSVADGVTLSGLRMTRSSGFEGTQYVLEALVSVATSVSSAVLAAWLTDKLRGRRGVAASVDGHEVRSADLDGA